MNHAAPVPLADVSAATPIGIGTWGFGEAASTRRREIAALRLAFEIGYRVVDTAEMYGDGGAEEVLGQAFAGALGSGALRRDELFVVSKVYPHHADRAGVVAACERSLRRLGLDHLDLYLLHWPGPYPLAETVEAFETLKARQRIRHWGVSNFDCADLAELVDVPGGAACAANQVFYALGTRGPEFDLLPWQRAHAMPLMAYCPLDQGRLAAIPALQAIGRRHGASASQVALAWLTRQPGVVPIPKAGREAHLRENFAAPGLALTPVDLAEIDRLFPPPRRKVPLAMR